MGSQVFGQQWEKNICIRLRLHRKHLLDQLTRFVCKKKSIECHQSYYVTKC